MSTHAPFLSGVREWSLSRKGLGTQYRDVSENEVFHFAVLSVRGSRALKPPRVSLQDGPAILWRRRRRRRRSFFPAVTDFLIYTEEASATRWKECLWAWEGWAGGRAGVQFWVPMARSRMRLETRAAPVAQEGREGGLPVPDLKLGNCVVVTETGFLDICNEFWWISGLQDSF